MKQLNLSSAQLNSYDQYRLSHTFHMAKYITTLYTNMTALISLKVTYLDHYPALYYMLHLLPAAGAFHVHKPSVVPLLSGRESPFDIRSTRRKRSAPICVQA